MSLLDIYKAKKIGAGISIDAVLGEKYGIVDLGELTWLHNGTYTSCFQAMARSIGLREPKDPLAKGFCSEYLVVQSDTVIGGAVIGNAANTGKIYLSAKGWSSSAPYIIVNDTAYSSYTEEEFKEAISGVYVIYELNS